jgi:oligopeptide/dipeptide ABC transporter ATP-binding protein
VVLYAGCVMEEGPVQAVLHGPQHPYTRALVQAVPRPGGWTRPLPARADSILAAPAGPRGCPFQLRCHSRQEACGREMPLLRGGDGHRVACYLAPPRGEA